MFLRTPNLKSHKTSDAEQRVIVFLECCRGSSPLHYSCCSRDRGGVFGRGGSLNVKLDLIGLNSFCFSLHHWELLSSSLCSPDQRDAGYSGASRLRSSLVSSNQVQARHVFAYRGALRSNKVLLIRHNCALIRFFPSQAT